MAIADKLLVCPSCGRRYDEPTHFCVDCGARLLDASADSAAGPQPEGKTLPAESGLPQTPRPVVEGEEPRSDNVARDALRAFPPATPARAPRQPAARRSDRPILIGIGLAAALVLVMFGAALYIGGVFDPSSQPAGQATPGPQVLPSSSSTATPSPPTAAPTTGTATAPRTASTPHATAPQPAPSAPGVTGRDANAYNTGPGCSDNPTSPLQGCADSPSVVAGDSQGSCPNGITIDSQTTSCGLAENVRSNYTSDGSVTASSPGGGSSATFSCRTGGQGTTGFTICVGQGDSVSRYVRWHP